mgnify:CR=1 FL=1
MYFNTLKKAAVIGAGAYIGYKLTKAAAQFSSFSLHRPQPPDESI